MENDFYINLEGLKEGNHEFQYQLNKSFFQSIDYAEIANGDFNVGLRLYKSTRHFELKFTFKGEVDNQPLKLAIPVNQNITSITLMSKDAFGLVPIKEIKIK